MPKSYDVPCLVLYQVLRAPLHASSPNQAVADAAIVMLFGQFFQGFWRVGSLLAGRIG